MKCPLCGYVEDADSLIDSGNGWITCPKCKGNGLTNEEFLRSCSTEELADFLIKSIKMCKSCASGIGIENLVDCPFGECGCSYKYEVMKWLQEKHT